MDSRQTQSEYDFKFDLLQKVISSLQCSKCKSVPGLDKFSQNRYHCMKSSHVLCENCKSLCKCRSPVTEKPSIALESLLSNLPCFCPNFIHGCRQIFEATNDLNLHKITCMFRAVRCPFKKCQEMMAFGDLMGHVEVHDEEVYVPAKEIDNQFQGMLEKFSKFILFDILFHRF